MSDQAPNSSQQIATKPLSIIIHQLIEKSYEELRNLSDGFSHKPDGEKKMALIKYFKKTRIQFIRLLVLVKWAGQMPTIQKCWDLLTFLEQQATNFREAADQLFFLEHETLRDAKAPIYDVSSAIDVLTTGTFQRMPTSIQKMVPAASKLNDEEREQVIHRLNHIIRIKLLNSQVPKQFNDIVIDNGQLHLTVKSEFKVSLTLFEGITQQAPWAVLSLEMFVAPSGSKHYIGNFFTNQVQGIAQERMKNSTAPLVELYSVVHGFVNLLQLDLLHSQSETQTQNKTGTLITGSTFKREQSTLIVNYWKPPVVDNNPQSAEGDISLKIAIDETNELVVSHKPKLVDVHSKKEPKLTVDPTNVSLEKLLSTAASLHILTMQRKIFALLTKEESLHFFKPEDISLVVDENDLSKSHIRVYLFDAHTLNIFVNIFNGEFILKCSHNFNPDFIESMEKSFNSDYNNAVDIVKKIRYSTIFYSFEQTANRLKLECLNKIPNASEELAKMFDENTLFLRVADASVDDYFIVVEIDSLFNTSFKLLATKKDQANLKLRDIYAIEPNFVEDNVQFVNIDMQYPDQEQPKLNSLKRKFDVMNFSHANQVHRHTKKIKLSQSTMSLVVSEPVVAGDHRGVGNSYQQILYSVIEACRTKIYTLCVLSQIEEMQIPFNELNWSQSKAIRTLGTQSMFPFTGYSFNVPCDPLLISDIVLSIYHDTWKVQLCEMQPSCGNFRCNAEKTSDHTIEYVNKTWIFSYPKINRDSFKKFMSDLRGLTYINDLLRQFTQFSSDPTTNPIKAKYFQVLYFSPAQLSIAFGANKQENIVHIMWKKDMLELSFAPNHFPLANFAAVQLNTHRSLNIVLETIFHCFEPLSMITRFVDTCVKMPGDFVLIPRAINCVRLLYRSTYAIDIRFLGGGRVTIEDANKAKYKREVKQGERSLVEILSFAQYLQQPQPTNKANGSYANGMNGMDDISQYLSDGNGDTNHGPHKFNVYVHCCVMTYPELNKFLSHFQSFISGLFHLSASSALLKGEGIEVTKKDEFPLKFESRLEVIDIGFALTSFYSGGLEFFVQNGAFHQSQTGKALDEHQLEILRNYYRTKINVEPYRTDYLQSFMRILFLPYDNLVQFIELMDLEWRSRSNPSGLGFELALASIYSPQKSFILKRQTTEISITIRLWSRKQVLIEVPINYNYKSNAISLVVNQADPRFALTDLFKVGDMKLTTIISNLLANDQKIVQIAEGLKRKVLTASKK
eukprot:TRINITY_DN2963_c0_g1_i1.p1 TRINITY_DN2963_c0_g1~~TRINITY_DN2963_c0_g1_i1.p1  ORF type:complete len:1244 (+),score=324.46 TRINITY_DN2963_c0_g1_i1:85-3816(+)